MNIDFFHLTERNLNLCILSLLLNHVLFSVYFSISKIIIFILHRNLMRNYSKFIVTLCTQSLATWQLHSVDLIKSILYLKLFTLHFSFSTFEWKLTTAADTQIQVMNKADVTSTYFKQIVYSHHELDQLVPNTCTLHVLNWTGGCTSEQDQFVWCEQAFIMVALCIIGQTIIFLPCGFFPSMFFPRLISVATEWMSTILLHMAWP